MRILVIVLLLIGCGNANSSTTDNIYFVGKESQEYINKLPDTIEQKKSLFQTAAAFEFLFTINLENASSVNMASMKLSNASSCMFSRYNSSLANRHAKNLQKIAVKGKERVIFYEKYNILLSGQTSIAPSNNGCI